MNSNTLNDFRHEIYRCFGKAKDALFNLVDALASEAEKEQKGCLCLRFLVGFFSSSLVFLGSEP